MKTYLRKYLAIILVCCMMLGMVPMSYAVEEGEERLFPDMPISSYWSYDALENAIAQGILKGDSNGMLNPQKAISRAEMATVLNRLFGAEEQANITMFSDVSENEWYYPEMAKAVQMKTFYGSADGKLNPTNGITREDAFTVIARAIKLEDTDDSALLAFADQANTADYARPYLAAMVRAGYVNGSSGKINPKATITREEVAQVLYNVIGSYLTTENGAYSGEQKGNVIINVPGVTVKDATIKGDLIIGDGVGNGEVTVDNTTVFGRVVVRGGGENSIKIVNKSNIGSVIVSKSASGKVRVLSADGAKVDMISVDDGSDDVKLEGTFLSVSIDSGTPVVLSDATVTNLSINAAQAAVDVESGSIANTVVNAAAESTEFTVGKDAKMGTISVPSDATVNIDGTVAEITVSADNSSAQAEAKINLGSTAKVDTIKAESGANTVLNADASAKINNIEAANKNDISINSDSATLKQQLESSVKETSGEQKTEQGTVSGGGAGGGGGSGGGGGDPTPKDAKVSNWNDFISALNNGAYDSITITSDITTNGQISIEKPVTVANGATFTIEESCNLKSIITNNGVLIVRAPIDIFAGATLTNNGTLQQYNRIWLHGTFANNGNYEHSYRDSLIYIYDGAKISGISSTVYAMYDADYYYADGSSKLGGRNVSMPQTVHVALSGASMEAYAYGEQGLKNAMDSDRDYSGLYLCKDEVAANNEVTLSGEKALKTDFTIEQGTSLTVADQAKLSSKYNTNIYGTLNIANGGVLQQNGVMQLYSGGTLNNSGAMTLKRELSMYPGSAANGMTGVRIYKEGFSHTFSAESPEPSTAGNTYTITGSPVITGTGYSYAYVYGKAGFEKFLKAVENYNYDRVYLYADGDSEMVIPESGAEKTFTWERLEIAEGVTLKVGSGNVLKLLDYSDIYGKLQIEAGGSLNVGYLFIGEAATLVSEEGATLVCSKSNWNVYGTLANRGTFRNSGSTVIVYAGANISGIPEEIVKLGSGESDYYYADGTISIAPNTVMINGIEKHVQSYSAIIFGTTGLASLLASGHEYESVQFNADEDDTNNTVVFPEEINETFSHIYIVDGVTLTIPSGASVTLHGGSIHGVLINNGTLSIQENGSCYIYGNGILSNNGTLQTTGNYTITVFDRASALNMQGLTVTKGGYADYYDEEGDLESGSADETTVTGATVVKAGNTARVVGTKGLAAALASDKSYDSYYIEPANDEGNNEAVLTKSLTLSSLQIEEGVSLTIPENVSLTVDNLYIYGGGLFVSAGAYLTITEEGYSYISEGTLTNNGTVSNSGSLRIDDGCQLRDGVYTDGTEAKLINNGSFTNGKNAYVYVYGKNSVLTNGEDGYFANYGRVCLQYGSGIVNLCTTAGTESSGFYNERGSIYVYSAWYGKTELKSYVTTSVAIENIREQTSRYAYTEEDLRYLLSARETNIIVGAAEITLTGDLIMPADAWISFDSLVVPQGITLTVDGDSSIRRLSVDGVVNVDGGLGINTLEVGAGGGLLIEKNKYLTVYDSVSNAGTITNNGSLSYSPTVEYPEDIDFTWFDNVSGTGTKSMSLCARTYSEDDFWAAQEDKNVSSVHYLGDSLTISDKKEIVKLTEISAPVTVTSDGELTLQDCRFHGAVTISGKIVCANNSEVAFNDKLTVSSTGTVENNGNTYINNIATIIGTLYQNGRIVIGSNWRTNKGVVEVESFGTLTLDEDATVTIGSNGYFYISKGAYLYQLCDLILPQNHSLTEIHNSGHYIASGILNVNGDVNNYADATFEIQSASVIGTMGHLGNDEGAVLQIQGNGGKLTNNGYIKNYGQIRIMQGGVLSGKAPINLNAGTVISENPSSGIFLLGASDTLAYTSDQFYYIYDAVINGEVVIAYVAEELGQYCDGFYRSYTLNENGVIIALSTDGNTGHGYDAPDSQVQSGYIHCAEGVEAVLNDEIGLGNPAVYYAVSDNCEIFYSDKSGKIIDISATEIAEDTDIFAYALVENGTIIKLFLNADASVCNPHQLDTITLATGGITGTYYSVGLAMENILNPILNESQLSVALSGGSKANINLMTDGEVQAAIVQSDVLYYAHTGTFTFENMGIEDSSRWVAGLYNDTIHVVAQSGIESFSDLQGKTVCVGDVGSGTEMNAFQILTALGIWNSITIVNGSTAEGLAALEAGAIDAVFIVAGTPATSIIDYAYANELNLLSLSEKEANTVLEQCPFFVRDDIEAETYTGQCKSVVSLAVQAVLVVDDSISKDIVYELTKAIYVNQAKLTQIHAKFYQLNIDNALNFNVIPLHSGAKKYYEEIDAIG